MTTITKERLLTIKQWRETYGPGSNVVLPAEEAEELARIALASLEAEPVASCIIEDGCMCVDGFGEYIALLIRQDDARVRGRIKSISRKRCGKCGEKVPVNSCPCNGDSQCWVTKGWHETKLIV